jgi:hypothetical protein
MGGTGLGGPYGDGLDERYMGHLKMKTKGQPSANPLYIATAASCSTHAETALRYFLVINHDEHHQPQMGLSEISTQQQGTRAEIYTKIVRSQRDVM